MADTDETIEQEIDSSSYDGLLGGMVGKYIGGNKGSYLDDCSDSEPLDGLKSRDGEEDDEEKKKKKGGGPCGGNSQQGDTAAEYPAGTSPEDLGEVSFAGKAGAGNSGSGGGGGGGGGGSSADVDETTNQMCKKVYTIFRAIPKEVSCPITQRDNVADQFTPQDDLITMEKTVRDFLKLEGKIYDPESTNPRFFASEDWVQHYEKDKNVVLAAFDQYKANILRMEHLYTVVDNNSCEKLLSIPNQDCKSTFQTNIMWTARALKDWAHGWFIIRGPDRCTKLYDKDYWLPGLTGQMVQWMKLGSYCEFNMRPVANETMIRKVDMLEGLIDRLMNKDAVKKTIQKFLNVKEQIEKEADQTKEKIFTSNIIDSQMGKGLGVTDTGVENQKIEGTTYIAPKEDSVEDINLVCKMSCVKKLFQTLRETSLETMKSCRCTCAAGPGPYPTIWCHIDELAEPVYGALGHMNNLVQDVKGDHENPNWHCSVTHAPMCPKKLKKRITAFKCVIEQGVIDVMVNQALLPKKGKNILDSMFNQLWEYGEKGPNIELPSWCQMAIDSINGFEQSLLDAWSEVFDCWEREFITRLWRISLEHHNGGTDGAWISCPPNWHRQQDQSVTTEHDHTHKIPMGTTIMSACSDGDPIIVDQEVISETAASTGYDGYNFDTIPLVGHFCCPGHKPDLEKPICQCYKTEDIEFCAMNFRAFVKELCEWMCAAVEAIGIKQAAISAVMADPTLNGKCQNVTQLDQINELREKNHKLLKKVEHAYGIYYDVENMKNKVDYD